MKLVKYSKSGHAPQTSGGGSGSGETRSEVTTSRGGGSLSRQIWGQLDEGDDVDGSMIINGNVRIQVIEDKQYEADDDGDDGDDVDDETGGGSLFVDENVEVAKDIKVGRHLYIKHSHSQHNTEGKCVSELIKNCEDEIQKLKDTLMPIGSIIMYDGRSTIPESWAICDGTNGTPNLRGKFIKGVGVTSETGRTGGNSEVTLDAAVLPKHTHSFFCSPPGEWFVMHKSANLTECVVDKGGSSNYCLYTGSDGGANYSTLANVSGTTGEAGTDVDSSGQTITIEPPYYTLIYIMKIK